MFTTFVLVLHIFICVVLVGIILLQQGKGADAGVAFGGGGGNTLFGAGGADNFLVRLTTVGAVLFFATSLTLAIQGRARVDTEGSLFKDAPVSIPVSSEPASSPAEEQKTEGSANAQPTSTTSTAVKVEPESNATPSATPSM